MAKIVYQNDVLTDIHAQLQSEFIKLNDAFMAEPYLAIDKRIKLLKRLNHSN